MVQVWAPRKGTLAFTPRVRAKELITSLKIKDKRSFLLVSKIGSMKFKDENNLYENATLFEIPEIQLKNYSLYSKVKGICNSKILTKIKVITEAEIKSEDFLNYIVVANLSFNFENIKGISRKKELIRELIVSELFNKDKYLQNFLDNRIFSQKGVTKGHGFSGVVKRMGLKLKKHKHARANKTRLPGAISTRGLARIPSSAPYAGQLGCQTRTITNLRNVTKLISFSKSKEFKHYGVINETNKILALKGSCAGPIKSISNIYYD